MADRGGGLDALLGCLGQQLLRRLAELEPTPASELAHARRLRREFPGELVTTGLALHELRRGARAKFRRADRMYFTRDGLEQASGEPLARHRAARLAGVGAVADLCCGIGGDLLALAAGAAGPVLAVDRDPVHLRMALLNATAYGVADLVRPLCADVRSVDLTGVDAVFVDPARRSSGPAASSGAARAGGSRRMRDGRSEPPLSWCVALAERTGVVVKAAPGLDRALVPAGWELEFVAAGRELKEAVLWSPRLAGVGVSRRATVLPALAGVTGSTVDGWRVDWWGVDGPPAAKSAAERVGVELLPEPGPPVEHREPGEYLYDPNPAVTRAGLVEDLARRLGAWKIDPMIAFLSGDRPLSSPFVRTLRVFDSAPWREKELVARLRALDAGAVDIRRRGLAGDVDALHRRLRPALTGSLRATLVMTRVDDRPWALICADA